MKTGHSNSQKKLADNLLILSRITAAVSGLTELETILKIGLEKTLEYLEGVSGGIMLLDEQKKILYYRVYTGLSERYAREIHPKIGEGIAGKVVQTGKAILWDDISQIPEAGRPHLLDREDLKAFICVPLRAKGNVLGVMNCAGLKPYSFTEEDMHLLNSIGDQLGIAIEQAKLYEQLQKSREKYRQIARQVIIAQEEERKRISKEIHDETSQMLAALTFNLQALLEMAEMIGVDNQQFKEMLKKALSTTVQIHTEVGRLIADLRPALLDTLGLIPAIRQHAESNLIPLGINVSFHYEGAKKSLAPEVEVTLFRWTQGVIGNIIQHSQAKKVSIAMKRDSSKIELSISDDGIGFDPSKLTVKSEGGHGTGMFIMKERLRTIGGDCLIQSQPGLGTTVTATIPLSQSNHE
jgi:signal transduction histidine kinase